MSVAPGAEVSDTAITCKLCRKRFINIQQCLAHDITEHALGLNIRRTEVSLAVARSTDGEELDALLNVFIIDSNQLADLCAQIRHSVDYVLEGNFNIYPYGSVITNLALKTSDVDLYVENKSSKYVNAKNHLPVLNKISKALCQSKDFTDVYVIRHARVPIVKCKHLQTNFSIDINMKCSSSVQNSIFIKNLLEFDKRLRQLVTFTKIWAKQIKIIGKANITSYGIIMLVIFYLQHVNDPETNEKLVASVEQLQQNEEPVYEQCANFAHNLQTNIKPWSLSVNIKELIRGFFLFYKDFDFDNFILSPYLGKKISKEEFQMDSFKFSAYDEQRHAMYRANGVEAEPLQLHRSVCLQDPFFLNHNITKSIVHGNLVFIRKGILRACSSCGDNNLLKSYKFYESLLFETGDKQTAAKEKQKHQHPTKLTYSFTPRHTEIQAIRNNFLIDKSNLNVYKFWTEQYADALVQILTKVYGLDVQVLPPTNKIKQQRLDYCDQSLTWWITGAVDLWTGRLHQCIKNRPFMEYQMLQTNKFLAERKQNSKYSVDLNAVLTMNVNKDNTAVELQIQKHTDAATAAITKKDIICKFFAMLKSSLQNFNLKEDLLQQQAKKNVAQLTPSPGIIPT